MTALLWFRGHDLRLTDNDALHAAAAHGPIVPVFIHAPEDEGDWPLGGAARWWLHHSLTKLDVDLQRQGTRLVIRRAPSTTAALVSLVEQVGATAVFAHRRTEPAAAEVEVHAARRLGETGVELHLSESHTLAPLGSLRTGDGGPYRVFTPFWRTLRDLGEPRDPVGIARFDVRTPRPASDSIDSLHLLDEVDRGIGLRDIWQPGELGAAQRLQAFCRKAQAYDLQRNRPDLHGTSSLSPHLRFGEISPRQAWHAVRAAAGSQAEPWLRQLAWRDFGHHLLYHFPHTTDQPLRSEFSNFPWFDDETGLRDWQCGRTGYPLVDAGMRQLWHTGWMHNRVRMVAASFLVKDLLVPWQRGARWYWDTLVDADLANNTLGWQWTAGCGADAAPYFRVFNPVVQSERFDPQADYIGTWVPELSAVAPRAAHRPWQAPPLTPQYPPPIVDHGEARTRALAAYSDMRKEMCT